MPLPQGSSERSSSASPSPSSAPETTASTRSMGRSSSGLEHSRGVALQRLGERGQPPAVDRQAGSGAVAAVALELAGAGMKRAQQVESGDAAGRPLSARAAVQRHEDRRPVVALSDPGGDDADHPGMPTLRRENVCRALAEARHLGLRFPRGSLLHRAALGVDRVELLGDLDRPLRILGQQELEARVGAAQSARGVDARRQAKAERACVECAGIGTRNLHQRPQAGLGGARERPQPLADKPAVLALQGHQIGDRGQGHQLDVLLDGRCPERLSQLEGHRRAAQIRAWIAADAGVNERTVRHDAVGAGSVVVGDHGFQAGGPRLG